MASTRNNFSLLPLVALMSILVNGVLSLDYKQALTNSLLYYEAQRSGQLPAQQRVTWRGDSGLKDGQDAGVDLVGGYYDAGDNVKFGLPMAFTVTLLAWSVVEFGSQLEAQNELQNALAAIKWGTDYFIKAHPQPNLLYAGVGDGDSDHQCWQRPEDMTTPRTVYKIDESSPGSDLAGETSAALAAASIAFQHADPNYSSLLVTHAKQLFDFAKSHPGKYSDSIPSVGQFYSSTGFQDELLWAAAWLQRATGDKIYQDFLESFQGNGGTRSMFSWDDKFVGAQILVAKQILEGKFPSSGNLGANKDEAEQFLCNCIQKGSSNIYKTSGGLLWFNEWNNLQYTISASLAITVYADYLSTMGKSLTCSSSLVNPPELIAFARSQVDYILGANPKSASYMVGYGSNFPQKVHHRGASIVSIKKDPAPVGCKDGFDWFHKDQPNPNVLVGAIVGGPDKNDNYNDDRSDFQQAEAATANSAGLVGVLARIS
uniref:Endoglucanase n=1 Tax=Chenopodium quinoa TaxID=63459 RepID=A0A803M3V3_CHEQI